MRDEMSIGNSVNRGSDIEPEWDEVIDEKPTEDNKSEILSGL